MIIHEFDASVFLAEYWQKKPCIVRNFIPNFVDPIDENDLAGLAQEETVDSRIVSYSEGAWQVSQGPFAAFDDLCVGKWTLLAQGVDKYIDELSMFTEKVRFIPSWRFDDVMVSFSNAGAGVGPHTDEYDVFIVQGKGTRRWQVGLPCKAETVVPHPLLKQITGFDPVIDEVLQAGDSVYIPPKHPHNGVALEDCINYSIGFRAPTNLEVLHGMLDESNDFETNQQRYHDPDIATLRSANTATEHISSNEIARLKEGLYELLNSDQAKRALLQYLSRQQLNRFDEQAFSAEDILAYLQDGDEFVRVPGLRAIYAEQSIEESKVFEFFIDGDAFAIDTLCTQEVQFMLSNATIERKHLSDDTLKGESEQAKAFILLLTDLVNAGLWDFLD